MQINQLPAYDRLTGALKNMEQALCRLVLAACGSHMLDDAEALCDLFYSEQLS